MARNRFAEYLLAVCFAVGKAVFLKTARAAVFNGSKSLWAHKPGLKLTATQQMVGSAAPGKKEICLSFVHQTPNLPHASLGRQN